METSASDFTSGYNAGDVLGVPIAHHDGNYIASEDELDQLAFQDRIAFTYTDNPNGAARNIAGILSENRRVLGMMPHPERAVEDAHGSTDGVAMFRALASALVSA